jgi:hypothetical protein
MRQSHPLSVSVVIVTTTPQIPRAGCSRYTTLVNRAYGIGEWEDRTILFLCFSIFTIDGLGLVADPRQCDASLPERPSIATVLESSYSEAVSLEGSHDPLPFNRSDSCCRNRGFATSCECPITQPCPARAPRRTSGIAANRATTDLRVSKAGRKTSNHEVSARISPIASARSMLQR